jgi:pyridinium-3,5-bisthiocarboxylic acid mononucleotide nickel chelatase
MNNIISKSSYSHNNNRLVYVEPHSGIAGDMFVAAMSEFFPDLNFLHDGLNSLPIKDEFSISFKNVSKNGIAAKHFSVKTVKPKSYHYHVRTLDKIISIINAANKITSKAKKTAVSIFKKLADAEATVHGTVPSQVHFHEVGAIDAIVDITAAAILLDALNVHNIISTPISVGQGTVKSAHGVIPIPSPATVELIKEIPVNYTTIKSELTTPTGAAILTTVTDKWNTPYTGILKKTGYGAGTKDIEKISNVLRVSLLEQNIDIGRNEEVIVIECNIDDYPAEHLSFLGPAILDKGALDFAIIPTTTKKGRQGMILQILSPLDKTSVLSSLLLKETTTLGIRYRKENRIILNRKFHTLNTSLGTIKIKLALDNNGNIIKAKPEQSEIDRISKQHNKSYFETYKYLDYCTEQWLQKNS